MVRWSLVFSRLSGLAFGRMGVVWGSRGRLTTRRPEGALRPAWFGAVVAVTVALGAGEGHGEPVLVRDIYVVDGDTIDVVGARFRLVGFDTPETYRAKCDFERALGRAATARLRALIASGLVLDLVVLPGRDKYNRGLARLRVGGRDVGEVLISERLARRYDGGRRSGWC